MDFKIYCTQDAEHFSVDGTTLANTFGTGLADFLYLDFFQDDAWSHAFFTGVDVGQLSDAKKKRLLADADALQKKLITLFDMVFDAVSAKHTLQKKLAEYAAVSNETERFSFSALSTSYAQVAPDLFAEILYPKSIEEIAEFFVRECLRRELWFRRCKSCGKYFALTGYSNTEYCDRLFGDSDKTCKEAGAVRLYRTKITADPVIRAFNKAYKKRFAWIKYKKISKEAFYEWSERARNERDKCLEKRAATEDGAEKLRALEELETWLRES